MTVVIRGLTTLAFLLLLAHSLRWGDPWGVACWAVLAGLQVSRQAWVRLVLIAGLLTGAAIWTWTAHGLIVFRLVHGLPATRLAVILGAVLGLTLLAAGLLTHGRARALFPESGEWAGAGFAACAGVVGLLAVATAKARIPLLLADRFAPGAGRLEMLLLGFYAAWLVPRLASPGTAATTRYRLWSLFSVVFFAQVLLGLAGFTDFLMTGKLHLPIPALIVAGPVFRGEGLFMLILYGVTLVVAGRAWCSHLCYLGAWDLAMARQAGKAPELPGWWAWLRVPILAVVLLAAYGARRAGWSGGEAALLAGLFGLGGVLVMVLGSWRRGAMLQCTAYCPIGLLTAAAGFLHPMRLRIDDACDGCGACSRVCRHGALTPAHLAARRPGWTCTLCGDCLGACARGRLTYACPGLGPDAARTLFVVVVVILHAVFLGVARI